ncbi:MAG TPA: thiamine biosynthesis protein ThiS [Persephonella sp.]|uniref:Thiamine biosynthesis protein ThiS n=1 Tax=Persephonella marina (strain DSM 14350 / EX-H1) TaxID=123214 RepID=C0QSJ1_PERMH|nr:MULTISPECIES: sulfur carrier protein ThiS [Persephonella]ACO02982.1 thiamine biosynthesis protein ThiS [Persephonella marina EX-H1]HCB69383.1 thiamine biosynthesis protein ThiS [Persephonella sp.]
MKVIINGEEREFDRELTIKELVEKLGIKAPNYAVAVGMEVIPKSEYDSYKIKDGDKVEIVTFVGGG